MYHLISLALSLALANQSSQAPYLPPLPKPHQAHNQLIQAAEGEPTLAPKQTKDKAEKEIQPLELDVEALIKETEPKKVKRVYPSNPYRPQRPDWNTPDMHTWTWLDEMRTQQEVQRGFFRDLQASVQTKIDSAVNRIKFYVRLVVLLIIFFLAGSLCSMWAQAKVLWKVYAIEKIVREAKTYIDVVLKFIPSRKGGPDG